MQPRTLVVTFCNQSTTPDLCVALLELPSLRARWLDIGADARERGVLGATGVAVDPDGFFVALQCSRAGPINRYDRSGELQAVLEVEGGRDLHSLWYEPAARRLTVASTGTDALIACTLDEPAGRIVGQELAWSPADGHDAGDDHHVNSVARHDDRMLATIFGARHDQAWAEVHGGAVLDVTRGVRLADALYHPHSLRTGDDGVWFVESGSGRVHRLGRNGSSRVSRPHDGYLRGLALLEDRVVVGVSGRRPEYSGSARLLVLDRTTLEVTWEASLGSYGREIYDLLPLPPGASWAEIGDDDAEDAKERRIQILEARYVDAAAQARSHRRDLLALREERDAVLARSEERLALLEEGLAAARADVARLDEARQRSHELVETYVARYDRLRRRRSVRAALALARLTAPVFRWWRGRRP